MDDPIPEVASDQEMDTIDNILNAVTQVIPKQLEKPKENIVPKRVGFDIPLNDSQEEKQMKPKVKPEFTATNAPTIKIDIPLEFKPKIQHQKKFNEDDFEGPTLIVKTDLNDKRPIPSKINKESDEFDFFSSFKKFAQKAAEERYVRFYKY